MKKTVYLMAAAQGLMMSANTMMISVVALAGVSLLHSTATLATLPMALQFFSMMLFTAIAGHFASKNGRRKGFLIGASIAIVGAGICYAALVRDSFWLFCVGCVFIGVFNAVGQQFKFGATEAVNSHQKAKAISWVMTGGVIAAFLGPMLTKFSKTVSAVDYAGVFLLMIGVYCISLLLLYFYHGVDIHKQSANQQPIDWHRLLKQPRFIAAIVGGMGAYAVMNFMMISAPLAMQVCGFSFADSATVLQAHFLFMFAPSFITGKWMTRYGTEKFLVLSVLTLLAAVLIGKYEQTFWVYWLGLALLGLGWNFGYLSASAMLAKHFEEYGNKPKVIFDTLVSISVTISAFTSGWAHSKVGWDGVLNVLIPVLIVMLLVIVSSLNKSKSL